MRDPGEKVSDEISESRLQLKRRLYHFQMKREIFVDEHMNRYTKFLTDLVNVDVEIDEEDKTVIILNSLLREEYETFTLTLINEKNPLTTMRCLLLL